MKKFISFGLLCLTLTACRGNLSNEVVKETYIHKYGVPVPKSDWESQGQDGKVVAVRKDGVTMTSTYVNGSLHGETSYTYPNSSTIQTVEVYNKGIMTAKREHFQSGVPRKEEVYENQELARLTYWYEDGTPAALESYEHGTILSGEYRTPLNVVESRVLEGNGTRICRANDGDLLYKDTIQGGFLVERVTYFRNGDPQAVTPFENGMIHGTRLTYLQGGLPNTVETWMHGKQEGPTITYLNGEKASTVPYVEGMKNGIESRYKDGKTLVEEVTWKDDVQHGPHRIYVDGEAKIEWFHQGELVTRALYERMNSVR